MRNTYYIRRRGVASTSRGGIDRQKVLGVKREKEVIDTGRAPRPSAAAFGVFFSFYFAHTHTRARARVVMQRAKRAELLTNTPTNGGRLKYCVRYKNFYYPFRQWILARMRLRIRGYF